MGAARRGSAMGAARRGSAMAVAALVAAAMWAGMAAAASYEVGDKLGWTIMGNPNYGAWANSKKFHVGDTIVFTYNKQFHNVMAVSKADYKSCDVTKPMATWSTGKDSVVLNTTGTHYYLCGYPGHCGMGQKVAVHVSAASSDAPSAAPSMAPAPATSGGTAGRAAAAAPSPSKNAAPSTVGCSVALAVAASVLSVAAAGLNLL